MATSVVQAKIDSDLKIAADRYLTSWGLDTSTAIRMFLAKVVETHSIPFTIGSQDTSDFYSDSNVRWLTESQAQAKRGEFVFKTMDELEKMAI